MKSHYWNLAAIKGAYFTTSFLYNDNSCRSIPWINVFKEYFCPSTSNPGKVKNRCSKSSNILLLTLPVSVPYESAVFFIPKFINKEINAL